MPRLCHDGERGAQDVQVPVEMDTQDRGPVVLRARREVGGPADAGDVHHGVERAELLDQAGEEGSHRLLVGHRRVRCPSRSSRVDDLLCRRFLGVFEATRPVDIDDGIQCDDEGAHAAQLLGDGGTDAGRPAGYDNYALLRLRHRTPPCLFGLSFRPRAL